ncbi:MAG: glycosyltransferase family 2 protein [Haloarculaceae archaeon]
MTAEPTAEPTEAEPAGGIDTGRAGARRGVGTDQCSSVVVGIPAYNEAATIGSVVVAAGKHVDEVVVVDDGSIDATPEIAREAGATVIRQDRNQGKGAAVRRALSYAREHDVEQFVLLDGDWQHDPSEIPTLLEPLEADEADVVVGSRYTGTAATGTPLHRRIGQVILDTLTKFGTGTYVSDSQSGFRALGRDAIERVEIRETGFGIETEMLRAAADEGLTVTEVPISINYDVPAPNTANSFLHGISVVDTVLRIVRDRRPLLFFGVPGLTLMAFGLGYGAYTMSIYEAGQAFPLARALYSSVTFMVGVLSVYSALIMHMLGNKIDRLR